jgi:hypothetical protein
MAISFRYAWTDASPWGIAVPSIRGSLDEVRINGALGWAYSPDTREKLTVQAVFNHTIIGEAVAELYREDLAAVGFAGGYCGYDIAFFREIDPLLLPFVVVKIDGGDVDLPRNSLSGYSEFFGALYRQHPASGRYHSVIGGCWTDRIDAAAVLRDRLEIGMIDADAGSVLAGFLQSGFAMVEVGSFSSATCATSGRTPDLTEVVCHVLQSAPALRLLRAVLEAQPLALSFAVAEGSNESFRQASAMEALPSPAECLSLIVPLGEQPVHLEVIRDSHLFPEFAADGQSRWINPSGGAAIGLALQQNGMVDRFLVEPGSIAVVDPGLIHRVSTQPDSSALRVHCTPSRVAPLDRILNGSHKEITLESGARIWI